GDGVEFACGALKEIVNALGGGVGCVAAFVEVAVRVFLQVVPAQGDIHDEHQDPAEADEHKAFVLESHRVCERPPRRFAPPLLYQEGSSYLSSKFSLRSPVTSISRGGNLEFLSCQTLTTYRPGGRF